MILTLIYIQSNTKTLWAYLQTFMKTSGLVLVFTNYQRIVIFQISSDQNSAFQIAKFNSSYIRLHGNNCDIPLFLQIDNSLNFLTQFIQSMQTVFECNNTILYTNVMCCSNHLSQWQMIVQASKSQSGYNVGSSQENSIRSLC